jgi:outer membrane lipoprotein
MRLHRRTLPALLAILLLAGCTSQIPLEIRQGPDSPAPAVARENLDAYAGQAVRWGGLLLETQNRTAVTRLVILARPLTRDGEPVDSDTSLGRFIAIVPDFLDPEVYAADRRVTVTGILRGSERGTVGGHDYLYPVVEAAAWYLWPEPEPTYAMPYPWWYDPWYGPWWYGSWYDPWWYDPWYYPHGYPHLRPPEHRPRPPPENDTLPPHHRPRHPPAHDLPLPPEPGTPRPPRHEARPPPGPGTERPRDARPVERQPPAVQHRRWHEREQEHREPVHPAPPPAVEPAPEVPGQPHFRHWRER